MKKIKRKTVHEDDRGGLYNLMSGSTWQEINFIRSKTGSVRGNHYHKKTYEMFYFLSGKIEIYVRDINTGKEETLVVKTNDALLIQPYELHVFTILEESSWLNMLSMPMDKHDPDIHRLSS